MEKKIKIDFTEFALLVEACIPPVPIQRYSFWQDVIDVYYFNLNKNERFILFDKINRSSKMKASIFEKDEDCLLFNARFDPNNQYKITTNIDETIECFKLNDKYYISKDIYIEEKNIKKIFNIEIK